jgi:hypothetical protein
MLRAPHGYADTHLKASGRANIAPCPRVAAGVGSPADGVHIARLYAWIPKRHFGSTMAV